MSNAEVYEKVTNKVIEALENGVVPWHKPWGSKGHNGLPRSMASGKNYRGVNVWLLGLTSMAAGYLSPWWGTYKQITAAGGQVRKGEKSTMVILWKPIRTKPDAEHPEGKQIFLLRSFNVFNAEQADGLPERFYVAAEQPHDVAGDLSTAADIVDRYRDNGGPKISTGYDEAYYVPALDIINVPSAHDFDNVEAFYGTLFHEITHSTGHSKRLAREGVVDPDRFGSHTYAAEELIAEMGAAMLSAVAGIDPHVERHAGYIASWLQALRNDHSLVVKAASAAQKAADWVLGDEPSTTTSDNDDELVAA